MVKVKKQLVSQDVIDKRSYGGGNPVTSVTVHQTGNPKKGANAQMHADLQSNLNPREASWQLQVDDKQAIQSFPDNIKCWAATDGRGPGNTTSIHIEMCINSDGDYLKTLENGAALVRQKLKEHKLGIGDVKRHFDWSNKFCPEQLMRGHMGVMWQDFLAMVEKDTKPVVKPQPSIPKPSTKPKLVIDGYMGPLTIMALQEYFKTPVDGYLSNPSLVIKALQKFLGTKQDGFISTPYSSMVAALQRRFGTPVDGKISKPSLVIKELQRRLNAGKL